MERSYREILPPLEVEVKVNEEINSPDLGGVSRQFGKEIQSNLRPFFSNSPKIYLSSFRLAQIKAALESPPVNYKHIRKGYHHIETEIILCDVAYHY